MWKANNQGVKEENSFRLVERGGDGQLGQRGLMARQQLEDRGSHIGVQINREGQLGLKTDCSTQDPSMGN